MNGVNNKLTSRRRRHIHNMPQSSEAQINLNQIQTISKKSADGRTSNKYSVSPRSIHGEESSPLSYEVAFPQSYGLTQVDRKSLPLSTAYRLNSINRTSFHKDFVFGAASSAYQILGRANGDLATDSYRRYKEDVAIIKNMGLTSYRFSIAWSRVLPRGKLSGGVNEEGIHFYNKLINELIANGLEPSVTLFHWDLPQALEDDYGGFLSPKIVNDYRDYAELCFKRFGDRVRNWVTFNEPWSFSSSGYDSGTFAPGRCSSSINPACTGGNSGTEPYLASHYQLVSHAVKMHKGMIGITLVSTWMVPFSNSSLDRRAANRALDFMLGWFLEPVTTGDYPLVMRSLIGKRLPKFTREESKMLKGSYDFVGLNYYTAFYAAHIPASNNVNFAYSSDSRVNLTSIDELNDATLTIQQALVDNFRIRYYHLHLSFIRKAIKNGVNVMAYYAWSVMDNFEWAAGYTVRFGVTYVDFDDGLKRYPKLSAQWFQRFLRG
ncbi:hypothetical protein LguiA_021676 [Lonicera macranthoides]